MRPEKGRVAARNGESPVQQTQLQRRTLPLRVRRRRIEGVAIAATKSQRQRLNRRCKSWRLSLPTWTKALRCLKKTISNAYLLLLLLPRRRRRRRPGVKEENKRLLALSTTAASTAAVLVPKRRLSRQWSSSASGLVLEGVNIASAAKSYINPLQVPCILRPWCPS